MKWFARSLGWLHRVYEYVFLGVRYIPLEGSASSYEEFKRQFGKSGIDEEIRLFFENDGKGIRVIRAKPGEK